MSLIKNDLRIEMSIGLVTSVVITYNKNTKEIKVGMTGEAVDDDMHNFSSLVCHAVRAMSKGIVLDRFFSPVAYKDELELSDDKMPHRRPPTAPGLMSKAKWTRSGYLRSLGATTHQYKHAHTVADALSRTGVFTCSTELLLKIPSRKPDPEEKEENNESS